MELFRSCDVVVLVNSTIELLPEALPTADLSIDVWSRNFGSFTPLVLFEGEEVLRLSPMWSRSRAPVLAVPFAVAMLSYSSAALALGWRRRPTRRQSCIPRRDPLLALGSRSLHLGTEASGCMY